LVHDPLPLPFDLDQLRESAAQMRRLHQDFTAALLGEGFTAEQADALAFETIISGVRGGG
jgi:hypothetical protein